MKIIAKDTIEQRRIGECLGANITDRTVILIDGELGAGKTTFTQGLGHGLNIKEFINSPTFTIAKQYEGDKILNHLDVYRLEGLDEDIGIEDYIFDEEVLVIEWSKFVDTSMFEEHLHIQINYLEDYRELIFTPKGSYYKDLVKKVERCII